MKVKANKRGFTLVELVVVIAILAIIAAIAIPCLINILDSTTASSGEAQAQTLNQVCQNAYNEIKAGTINNTMSKNADGTAVSFAAIKNSGITTRKNAARNAKVSDIAKYSGLNINIGEYYYCTSAAIGSGLNIGTIVYSSTGTAPNINGCTFTQLDNTITLGTLYNNM